MVENTGPPLRFEKLDVMYRAFLNFALIMDMVKC